MYRIAKNKFEIVRSMVVEDVTEDIKDVAVNSHSGQIFFAGEKGIIYSQLVDKV